MIVNPSFSNLIEGDKKVLEKSPFEAVVGQGVLAVLQYAGYLECLGAMRDMKHLNHLWSTGTASWEIW